jgi:hypothetical protein
MTRDFSSLASWRRRSRLHRGALLLASVAWAFAIPVSAQAPAAPTTAAAAPAAKQMDALVGRIAL